MSRDIEELRQRLDYVESKLVNLDDEAITWSKLPFAAIGFMIGAFILAAIVKGCEWLFN